MILAPNFLDQKVLREGIYHNIHFRGNKGNKWKIRNFAEDRAMVQ
jgi:hypothetical protein